MAVIQFRRAQVGDLPTLQRIRERAFAPVFASFRNILGHEIYELAQRREDEAQAQLLAAIFHCDSVWEAYVADCEDRVIGFVCIRLDGERFIGEIGLNAIDPNWASKGLGLQMYEHALRLMSEAGMKVAVVATGADASHGAARRAYRKAGFDVEIPSVWMCRKL
jgi:GNAT superfamily N-acetyltransferase